MKRWLKAADPNGQAPRHGLGAGFSPRFARLAGGLLDRLGRSSGVFFMVLIVLCGVEVAVDWNSTLFEINVLRAQLKEKATHYADLLRKAAEPALLAYDAEELDRLSAGLFDDDELVYVRFTDLLGNTLYDRLRPDYARTFVKKHKETFRAHYRHPMQRDAAGLANDPVGLRERMEKSRHRDFIQAFTDTENALIARFTSSPATAHQPPPRVLYQDRLADPSGARDSELSYAVGAITSAEGEVMGEVLVAFRHDKLNRAVAGKLLKGLGIVLFFVGLILVQNVSSRKSKLRLMDLEAAQKAAREAVRSTLPKTPTVPWGQVGVALRQADGVGGLIYDLRVEEGGALELLLAVPDGGGVDSAFAAVALLGVYRRLSGAPDRRLEELFAEYDRAPLGRALDLLWCRIDPDGGVRGVCAGLPPPSVVSDGGVRQIAAGEPLPFSARRLRAPLRPFQARLGTLLIDPHAAALLRQGLSPQEAAERAVAGKDRVGNEDDFCFVATRQESRQPSAVSAQLGADAE